MLCCKCMPCLIRSFWYNTLLISVNRSNHFFCLLEYCYEVQIPLPALIFWVLTILLNIKSENFNCSITPDLSITLLL